MLDFTLKDQIIFLKNNKNLILYLLMVNYTIDQTIKDISNSLKILDKNGIILIHDYHIIRDFNHFIKKLFGPYYAVKIINNRLNKKLKIIKISHLGNLIRKDSLALIN